MSHSINCVVDTTPMAKSLDRMTKHVNGTTTAVVGMQTAVVDAQSRAADRVCADINRGFYALIHSQISRKIAKLKSDVDSHVFNLNRQMKQLTAIRERMQRDYAMLERRYSKLFMTINRNLRQRINELDKPVMDFATREMDRFDSRAIQLGATVPVGQDESIRTSQRILSSNIKYRAGKALDAMAEFIRRENTQRQLTRQTLIDSASGNASATIAYPVIVWESHDNPGTGGASHIEIPSCLRDTRQGNEILAGATSDARHLDWDTASALTPDIRSHFDSMLAADNSSDRVKRIIAYYINAVTPMTPKSMKP